MPGRFIQLFQHLIRTSRWSILIGGTCAAALLCTGCAGRTTQYPLFPDQAKRIEDPAKARVYLIRPPGGMNANARFLFYGTGPAATGPKVDPREWLPVEPLLGMYPQNPSPESPWRMIGEVASGTYLCWEEPPRILLLPTYQNKTNGVTSLNLAAGNVYYLRATMPGFWHIRSDVDIIPEEEGQALLKKCRPPAGYGGENQK